ncbi:DNA translocase FtsK 4TM domain-containing protein [candidate division WWE3 bacterium]|uniref:DNA translocase FtsK 4TM domain-containing protein n=1 Tax=candidate division WWE3 bacterium TaxID=2053526 RepID=A0A955LGB7_UNCKA|nr:DNA translocase FtsK 4TM domain-containing protein [candidate division WWE3 bacterium]
MPRKKKRFWELGLKPKSSKSLVALVLLLFSMLSMLSIIGQAMDLENSLFTFLQLVAGKSVILVPFVLFFAGLSMTKIRWEIAQSRIFWGLLIETLGLSSLFHLIFNSKNSIELAKEGAGGGLIGYYFGGTMIDLFSVFGALLMAMGLLVIGLVIIFNTSLEELGEISAKIGRPMLGASRTLFSFMKRGNGEEGEEAAAVAADIESDDESSTYKINQPVDDRVQIEIVEDDAKKSDVVSTTASGEGTTSEAADIPPFELPGLGLLSDKQEVAADRGDIEKNAAVIERTLDSFGVQARVAEVNLGPAVTQYALNLAEGTKITKITSLQNDLALALAAPTGSVRIEAPIPGKKLVGIEVPNYTATLVTMRNTLMSEPVQNSKAHLMVTLGQNVSGETVAADLSKWPHVLIAGATGSGKSYLLHALIVSLLYRRTPEELQFMFIDPKRVELTQYNGIPHLLRPVIVDADKAVNSFKWAVHEMEHRYKLFQQIPGVRDLASFNEKTDTTKLPYIVIVVDEMADLMAYAKNEAEGLITRLAQMSRATGIHLVLATQRPSVDVITGLIKANIPTRIALNVTSITDSRVVLDSSGAEKLIGKGDMLYLPPDASKPRRIQGVYVSDSELRSVIDYLKQFARPVVPAQVAELDGEDGDTSLLSEVVGTEWHGASASGRSPDFEEPDDNKFDDAVREIINHDRASASLLQRRLSIGYARAARLLDELEERGMVSLKDGSNPRDVYKDKVQEYLIKSGQVSTDIGGPTGQTFI